MSRQHNPVAPSQHEWHYRDPFWGGWSPGYVGDYDSNYYYAPTQAQATTAQTRAKDYLNAVRKGRRRAATHRYIAVETLKPTKNQLEDYKKKQADAKSASAAGGTQLSNRWVPPSQLRCVMVFDTQSKQFVGSGCYVIGSLPSAGTIAKFETFSAEFVGTPTLCTDRVRRLEGANWRPFASSHPAYGVFSVRGWIWPSKTNTYFRCKPGDGEQ